MINFAKWFVLGIVVVMGASCASAPMAKIGHWEGNANNVKANFDVTSDSKIKNMELTWKQGTVSCKIKIEEVSIAADGKFAFSENAANSGTGETLEDAVKIIGEFSNSTKMTGKLSLKVCEGYIKWTPLSRHNLGQS